MTYLYAHPFTFDVHYEERGDGGWTSDCNGKKDFDPHLVRFSCRVWRDGDYVCSLLLGEETLRETEILKAGSVAAAKPLVEAWCAEVASEVIAALAASGIAAPSGGETPQSGSTEGKSPTRKGDAQ